ncbi:FAD-binding oxidoreductase [Maritimibacter dapengensis]|uniref:FAD-binding oxidoreductase n=1 Tax=Maritimibacter dapengensis TaxID=2836868 RepID=A0ABS6SX37_9RHOB|nr:FAD-binding oxidoreductase [Maritimibacter dapengensis]MBV7377526.1 FAD-binding oxidoreductase [Maritimibacter dapengensis]
MAFEDDAAALIGAAHVLTGADMAAYATDSTGTYVSDPLCVLRPGTTDEVSALLRLANDSATPVVPVSGNTGVSGGTFAAGAAMLSLERLNRIRDIRDAARIAVVEAGVIVETLQNAAAERGLLFPVSFGAQGSARIGGILSTNAGGSNVLRYGNTRAQVLGVEVVLADGRVMDLMTDLHKDNSGYDLRDLVIGAEGTLGIITAAVVKLVPAPARHATAILALRDLPAALTLLGRLQAASAGAVEAFEYMPRSYVTRHLEIAEGARAPFDASYDVNVLVELGGPAELAETFETELESAFESGEILDAVIAQSEAQRREMWTRREAAAEVAFSKAPVVATDIALPLDRVDSFFPAVRTALAEIDADFEDTSVAHLGDGNIHYVVYPTRDEPGLKDRLMQTVEKIATDMGGTFSAEHGVGLSKRPAMTRHKDPVALEVMRAIKVALDPKGILNPGKVIPD